MARGPIFSRAQAAGLGVPIGHVEFARTWAETRVQEERILLEHLPQLPDLQCAWLLLALCATPRANHALRTVPQPEVPPYAQLHDAAVGRTPGRHLAAGTTDAQAIAQLPAALGGLGLLSLPVPRQRLPAFAETCARLLEGGGGAPSLRRTAKALSLFQVEGWERAPHGGTAPTVPARPGCGTQAWAIGHVTGSHTRREFATIMFASACFCQPCPRRRRTHAITIRAERGSLAYGGAMQVALRRRLPPTVAVLGPLWARPRLRRARRCLWRPNAGLPAHRLAGPQGKNSGKSMGAGCPRSRRPGRTNGPTTMARPHHGAPCPPSRQVPT